MSDISTRSEAVIFVPGLTGAPESARSMAGRLSSELQRISSGKAVLSVTDERDHQFGVGCTAKLATIKSAANGIIPDIDFYYYNYRPILVEQAKNRNPLKKAFGLLVTLAATMLRFLAALFKPQRSKGISNKDKLQIFYGLWIVGLMVTGVLIAAISLYGVSATAISTDLSRNLPDSQWIKSLLTNEYFRHIKNFTVALVPVLAAIGLTTSSVAKATSSATDSVEAMMNYFTIGYRKGALTGPLEDLLISVTKQNYDSVHIFAYSFGSILTLDTLFPRGEDRTGSHFNQINTLVTIGCPFDLVRFYFPQYFDGRHVSVRTDIRWLNVYAPIDVLGSNFRNDAKDEQAEIGIGTADNTLLPDNLPYLDTLCPGKVSFISILQLLGLRAHGMYWEETSCSEISSFRMVVESMFGKS